MTEIIIKSKGEDYAVLIDQEDYEKFSKHTWWIDYRKTNKYCRSIINGKYIYLHRFILGLDSSDKRVVDHINNNGLDNRQSNLKICDRNYNSQSINCAKKNFGCIDIMKGKRSKKYQARVRINKNLYYEYFSTREDAEVWLDDMKELAEYLNSPFHS